MKSLTIKIAFLALTTLGISSTAIASHPVEANIEISQESLKFVRLHQVRLTHDNDGQYSLSGKVRRLHNIAVPSGHFDLKATDSAGKLLHEDAEYYWPRIVNRQYKYPSEFVFRLPENIVSSERLELSFQRNALSNKPKPHHEK